MVLNNPLARANRPDRVLKFSPCPQCGRKGMYQVRQQYWRCRYCGLYRVSSPEREEA